MRLLILSAVLLCLAVSCPGRADYLPWTAPILNLSNTPTLNDSYPEVNASGHVVWHGSDGNDTEIWYWDGSSTTNLSNHDGRTDRYARINASGHVVWQAHDGTDYEIWHWDGSDITNLTGGAMYGREPRISDNGDAVWISSDPDDHELWRWDGSSSSRLTDNDGLDDDMPEINANGHVVWRVWDQSQLTSEVWHWDGVDETNLSAGTGTRGFWPQINDSAQVVWEGGDDEVYYWNGSTATNLSNREGEDSGPQINASGHVVWWGRGTEGYPPPADVYYWNGSTVMNVSGREQYDDMFPCVDDSGWVAWIGADADGMWQVFAWDGGSGRYQLTDDPWMHYDVRINNGWITWYGGSSACEVYLTDVRGVPEPATAGLVAAGLLGLLRLRSRRRTPNTGETA